MKVEHPTHAGSRPEYPSRATAAGFALAVCLLGSIAQAQNTATPPVSGQPAPASGKPDSAEQQRCAEENRQLIETARKVLDGNLSRKGVSSSVETAGGMLRTRGKSHITPSDLEEYRQDKQAIERAVCILGRQIKAIESETDFIDEQRKQECARQVESMKLVIQLLQQYQKGRGDHIRYWLPQPEKDAAEQSGKKADS